MTLPTPAAPTADDVLQAAAVALDEGRPEDTLELLADVLSWMPEHPTARFLQAEALRDLREALAAESAYKLVLSTDPAHSPAWSGLGAALLDLGRLQEAGRCFARAIRVSAENPDAFYGRAILRERRGDVRGAHRDYTRAWRLSSRYPIPRDLSDNDALDLLHRAAAESPSVLAWLQVGRVSLQELPELDVCEAYDPPAPPGELLGHVTAPFTDPSLPGTWHQLPPTVVLYRKNLARYAEDPEQVVQALREGLVGEIQTWLDRASPFVEA